MHGRGRPGPPMPGYGVPYNQQIPEEEEDEYEDLQLFPFDEPTTEDVLWMAQLIGIHPLRDKEFLYLAREALINPPTDEWMIFKDIAGNVIWINDVTEEMEPHPPHLHELAENFERVKKKAASMNSRNSSNDRSNAMKKILGRNLVAEDSVALPEPLAKVAAKPQSTALPKPGSKPISPPTADPPAKPQTASEPPAPSKRGGGLSLLKALQHAQQTEQKEEAEKPPEKDDSVFDRKLGADDEEDELEDPEDDNDDDEDYHEKGILIGENEDESISDGQVGISREESEDDEVYPKPSSQVELKTQNNLNSKKTDHSKPQTQKPTKEAPKKKDSNDKNKQSKEPALEKELENSKLLNKLMSDFQQMQSKMSQIEEENRDLKKKNEEINRIKEDLTKNNSMRASQKPDEDQSNIKSGIAEIKKLLEKSILIQNDKTSVSNDQRFEENRSVLMAANDLRMTDMSRNHGASSHTEAPQADFGLSHNRQPHRFSETETKWAGIINREKENVHLSKLNLQNEKIIIENRKLAIKKHEFEMRKELEQMKLEKGHPLSTKIKDNLLQQLSTFRNEFAGWKDKCVRLAMQQRNLNLLEKSFNFSKTSGPLSDACDKHLEDLYGIYRDSYTEDHHIEMEKELGIQMNDDGLSLDSHPADFDSEHHGFDDNQSKSEKTASNRDFMTRISPMNIEASEFNYNIDDIRKSMLASANPGLGSSAFDRPDPHKDNIRKYFANQSRFYSLMRKEVRSVQQVEGMVSRYSSGGSRVSSIYY